MPEQPKPAGAVFLSYASQDAAAAARICEALRAAGIEVWFDQSELRGGDAWDSKIKKQIHDCALFVPLISAHTDARTEGYFRREWRLATRRLQDMADDAAFLVPIVIDESREGDARVPEEFLRAHWTRLPGGETPPAFANRVRQLLGVDDTDHHTSKSMVTRKVESIAQGVVSVRPGRKLRVWNVGLALIALLLVLGGGLFWYYQRANDAPVARPTLAKPSPPVAAAPNTNAIAVLPFVNMSSDKEQEYFSDGLSEELLNLLAKVPELRVAARTSSFYFKGKDVKLSDVARELQVAHLLEGSVRKSGNRVRVTAQLIRASDGYHQWSETYDRTLEDVFAVQEEIAAAVVSQLKIRLLSTPPKARQTNPEAYALYLQAQQLDRQGTGRFDESIALYQQVLAIDPNYAPAWLELGKNNTLQVNLGLRPVADLEKSREMANKALAIDPEYGLAHAALGWLALNYDLDLAAAAKHFERALALDPANPRVLAIAHDLSRTLGRRDLLRPLVEYMVSRDPMAPSSYASLGVVNLLDGRLEDAIANYRTALKLSPDMIGLHEGIGDALLLKGNYEAALTEYKKEQIEPFRLAGLAQAHHKLGHASESDAALAELIEKHSSDWAFYIAVVYAYRGQIDRAFAWLENAAANRDYSINGLQLNSWLSDLHDDPRWLPFLRKHGRAPEQLAAIKFELKVPTH